MRVRGWVSASDMHVFQQNPMAIMDISSTSEGSACPYPPYRLTLSPAAPFLAPASLTLNAPLQICSSMNPKVNMDISGNDIACSGQSFCKVCGGLPAVSDGCMKESRCVSDAEGIVARGGGGVTQV